MLIGMNESDYFEYKNDRPIALLSRQHVVAMVTRTVVASQRSDVIIYVISVAR